MTPSPSFRSTFVARWSFIVAAALSASPLAHADNAPVEKVVVNAVAHFDFDTDSVQDADQDKLLSDVGRMKDVTWQTVTATGYTDSVGSRPYNERLSKRRATAVKSYLVSKGIGASMVRVQGKASEQPIASNSTDEGRAANRRTEVRFEGIRSAP